MGKEETTPRLGPRLNGRGLPGQPKQIIKTLLGQGDPANFTVDNIRNNGYGTLLKRTVKRCWKTHFDMGQGKADAIQENTSRKEMKSLPLQNSTRIALDEKMRDYWLIRTSALSEQEIAGIPTVTERSTGLCALKKAIQQTIVSRPREEVRDDRREREDRARDKTSSAGDNFHTRSDGEKSESETDL